MKWILPEMDFSWIDHMTCDVISGHMASIVSNSFPQSRSKEERKLNIFTHFHTNDIMLVATTTHILVILDAISSQ